MPCGQPSPSTTGCGVDAAERDDATGARLGHQHGAVGGDGNADRGVQTRRQDLEETGPGRQHPAGALLDEHHIATGGDRHTVELVETLCDDVAFTAVGPEPRDLTT